MKRFHIHVGVKDLGKSVQFYSILFGHSPTKLKEDYAKWTLEDPRLNFAISTRTSDQGVDHLGIQVEEPQELAEISERLKKADLAVYEEGETTCCYSESDKAWVEDPSGIAWEAYRNMGDAEVFREKKASEEPSCCISEETQTNACC